MIFQFQNPCFLKFVCANHFEDILKVLFRRVTFGNHFAPDRV